MRQWLFWWITTVVLFTSGAASAFCGFYVAGADAKLFNNATMVVMMRQGTRTVLSMQNNYEGPPRDFAMVVPVPTVLQEGDVKTLPNDVFARVDRLAAPRLVEYWEQDPCAPMRRVARRALKRKPSAPALDALQGGGLGLGVTVEARFEVGEYDVVILGAQDSAGLDTWLRREGYNIPAGAEPVLRPYVEQGMKFFVAKVDVSKVRFENGQARLSPLRFHYDSEAFFLPVRLGLLNSRGTQDLIVHVLAQGQRYEVANYDNVTIPTNLNVIPYTSKSFASFYVSLFEETLRRHPGAVVTEYAWASSTCDPCPSPPLSPADILTLGGDVVGGAAGTSQPSRGGPSGYVLTRLHARYTKDSLGEDLVFRASPPIAGGREFLQENGQLEEGAVPAGFNNFQGRYAIRHRFRGAISCKNPRRGIWGGPWQGLGRPEPQAAQDLAFVQRGVPLSTFVKNNQLSHLKMLTSPGVPLGKPVPDVVPIASPTQSVQEPATAAPAASIAVPSEPTEPPPAVTPAPPPATSPEPPRHEPTAGGCGGCVVPAAGDSGMSFGLYWLIGLLALRRGKRSPRVAGSG